MLVRYVTHRTRKYLELTYSLAYFLATRSAGQENELVTPIIFYLTQVSALRRVYGKISNFPKKHTAFHQWQNGDSFNQIAKKLGVAEATAEIYVIDLIASGLGGKEEHSRLLTELEVPDAAFEEVEEKLTQSRTTLRQIFEETSLGRYNEIRAIIAVMINGFEL